MGRPAVWARRPAGRRIDLACVSRLLELRAVSAALSTCPALVAGFAADARVVHDRCGAARCFALRLNLASAALGDSPGLPLPGAALGSDRRVGAANAVFESPPELADRTPVRRAAGGATVGENRARSDALANAWTT